MLKSAFLLPTLLVGALSHGCTQHNPAVCCNTPTQCTDLGLDQMYGCDPGKVCDPTGACVRPACATSAECTSDAPYCGGDSLCTETCTVDTECPGGGQDAAFTHCVMGTCVECATSTDCPTSAPVCASSSCRLCEQNSECGSQLCGSDGLCVVATDIAYANPVGVDSGNCEQSAPCTLSRAVSIGRPFTAASSGLYTQDAALMIGGQASIIGVGTSKPTITRSTPGPVVTISINAHAHLENLQISGATNTSSTVVDGDGVFCPNDQNPRTLGLTDVIVTGNMNNGVYGNSCTLNAVRSVFSRNLQDGVYVKDHPLVADQCNFTQNTRYGVEFDGTIFQISNSFITNNVKGGMLSSGSGDGAFLRFNTIASNAMTGVAVGQNGSMEISNNLFAANTVAALDCQTTCSMTGNITLGADMTSAHFKDAPGFDFHITSGSVAIDAATTSMMDHDFDGDTRPMGNGRDVGADEAQ